MGARVEQKSATETTPLLASPEAQILDPGSGIAPEGPQDVERGDDVPAEVDSSTPDDQESASKPDDDLAETRKRLPYIFASVALGVYLSSADQTLVVTSYGKIGTDLDALNLTSWISTAYFLTLTSFQPLYGRLSDIFGRKPCLLAAYLIFAIGCVFCGLATSMFQLIAARAIAGIGGGGMNTVVSILLSDLVPLRNRGTWQGYINIIFALGAGSGAPLGGFLADGIGWRWAFLAQGPLCMVAFVAVLFTLHLPKRDESDWKKKLSRIDFLGAGLLITAVFTLLLALDRGGNVGWEDKTTLISAGISVPLFCLFAWVEVRVAAHPVAPVHIIFNREMLPLYLCNGFAIAGWFSTMFYIPLYWQAVENITSTAAGVRLLPSVVCGSSGSLVAGFYMKRTGKYKWSTVLVYGSLTLGMVLIVLCSGVLVHSTPLIIVGLCINAFSNGFGITSTLIGLIATASPEDQAVATACSYLFRSMGGVFGISMSATVANGALREQLASSLPRLGLDKAEAIEIADRVRQSLEYLRQLEPDVRSVVVKCYAKATSNAFAFQTILVVGSFVAAWFVREKGLNR